MEANRPDPVDLKEFGIGEKRIDVLAKLGSPASSVPDSSNSCDIYKLYTHGPGRGGKTAIAVGEAAADVFTLGLAEVVFTPVEAGTKSGKHTVLFCYDNGDKLVSVRESEMRVSS